MNRTLFAVAIAAAAGIVAGAAGMAVASHQTVPAADPATAATYTNIGCPATHQITDGKCRPIPNDAHPCGTFADACFVIRNGTIQPATLTVKAGTTVMMRSLDADYINTAHGMLIVPVVCVPGDKNQSGQTTSAFGHSGDGGGRISSLHRDGGCMTSDHYTAQMHVPPTGYGLIDAGPGGMTYSIMYGANQSVDLVVLQP